MYLTLSFMQGTCQMVDKTKEAVFLEQPLLSIKKLNQYQSTL